MYGAIEAGGTKWRCAIGTADGTIVDAVAYPTGHPRETIARAAEFFAAADPLEALGVGSFGPVDLSPSSGTYGYITTTPKRGWRWTDLLGTLQAALDVPVAIDTDVNAAALGESIKGAARGLDVALYMTVGTGIGGGAIVDGRPLHGLSHLEIGHTRVPHDLTRDPFPGVCPYHGDCLEGLASGQAIQARWHQPGESISTPAAWELEAEYLAQAVTNAIFSLAPQRVILGGGVLGNPTLLPLVRRRTRDLLSGYLELPELTRDRRSLASYIVRPELGSDSALVGALLLARNSHLRSAATVSPEIAGSQAIDRD
jgi:fructokinase